MCWTFRKPVGGKTPRSNIDLDPYDLDLCDLEIGPAFLIITLRPMTLNFDLDLEFDCVIFRFDFGFEGQGQPSC